MISLNLGNNVISKLDSANLPRDLKILKLNRNQLIDILDLELESLEELDISYNEINTIKNLKSFKSLITLNLSNNHLKSIVNSVASLRVEYLDLSFNQI